MNDKDELSKNKTVKTKLPATASAIEFDRDKNQSYWPKDESVETPEHLAKIEVKVEKRSKK